MSVFHRVDDITALDGPTLFKLAWRLPAYSGVVRAVLQEQQESQPSLAVASPPSGGAAERRWNPGTRATLMADPDVKGLFSFGTFE